MSRYWARGKLGQHERGVRVAPGAAECNFSLECSPNFPSAQYLDMCTAAAWTNCFITERHQGSARRSSLYCDRAQNSLNAHQSKQTRLLAGQKHATFLFKFKFAKRATCKFSSALFLLLDGWGPKKSMPIEKLGSSPLVSSIS